MWTNLNEDDKDALKALYFIEQTIEMNFSCIEFKERYLKLLDYCMNKGLWTFIIPEDEKKSVRRNVLMENKK